MTSLFQKKSPWNYVVAALHLPHRESKAEQIWHFVLQLLLSLALIVFGFLLGLLVQFTV